MVYFGKFLKDYLEFNDLSQSEFAMRMGITQKHMNELLNGKTNITLEMAANIERLTGIDSSFIINVENSNKIKEKILNEYGTVENVEKQINEQYHIKDLKKTNWIKFKDETNILQMCIDILDFLKVKDFNVVKKMEEQVLFKKTGNDFKKIALWIAHCDEVVKEQKISEYNSYNLLFLIKDLNEYAYNNTTDIHEIKEILNKYGIYFACEKAMPGSKVRGCFKVKGNKPAIYITDNYAGKDSLFFELFHEIGHCKSDYNEGKSKVIIDGNEEKEKRADQFALRMMIRDDIWKQVLETNLNEEKLENISEKNKIPMSFIVGRLAKIGKISYRSKLYRENFQK
ncbi:MAG: helix-turn-helix domain-containing protein [Clostridia bacterium]|nr:helix-turn-helix domain-containing protein [Clostridia bacterium]